MRVVAAAADAHRLPDVAIGGQRVIRTALDPDLIAEVDVDLVARLNTPAARVIGIGAHGHLTEEFSFHVSGLGSRP
jgi:hypothetical protein